MPKVQLSVGKTVTAAVVVSLAAAAVPGLMTATPPSLAAVKAAAWVTSRAAGAAVQVSQLRNASAPGGHVSAATPGAQLWLKRYNGPGNSVSNDDLARSVAVSPGGATVFVTGGSTASVTNEDYVTIAYDAATGTKLWLRRWGSSQHLTDEANAVTVSPDGGTVFVTGSSSAPSKGNDYATVAYNAATGARLWVRRFNGPTSSNDFPTEMVAAGNAVYVTGWSIKGVGSDFLPNYDYLTVAYNAATGAQLWVRRYNGAASSLDGANGVAVSPGGDTVYVTGTSTGTTSDHDYVTIAYSAATGARLWTRPYNDPSNGHDGATAVTVSPTTGTVFVTGDGQGTAGTGDYTTLAYAPATGDQLWVRTYDGTAGSGDSALALTVGPGGHRVYVTGESWGSTTSLDYATVAYDTATGNQLWATRYDDPASSADEAFAVGVSPGGGKVYVTGRSAGAAYDYATVAYDTATGNQLWAARYTGPGSNRDEAYSLAVSPSTRTVFVTGHSMGTTSGDDYATIAYRG
jgi:outer membrane protein assembly factor BamB